MGHMLKAQNLAALSFVTHQMSKGKTPRQFPPVIEAAVKQANASYCPPPSAHWEPAVAALVGEFCCVSGCKEGEDKEEDFNGVIRRL